MNTPSFSPPKKVQATSNVLEAPNSPKGLKGEAGSLEAQGERRLHQLEHKLTLSLTLEYQELIQGWCAFRLSTASSEPLPDPFKHLQVNHTQEGMGSLESLQAFEQGLSSEIVTRPWVWAHEQYLQKAQQEGFVEAEEWAYKRMLNRASGEPELLRADVFKVLVEQKQSIQQLVRVDRSGHMLFDYQERSLPVALRFDYINGHMDNQTYDLEALVAELEKNPQVTFESSRQRGAGVGQRIEPIPHYNQDEGRVAGVAFRWSPTAEQSEMLWKKALSKGGSYPSTLIRALALEMDCLGLKGKGILKGEKSPSSAPKRKGPTPKF